MRQDLANHINPAFSLPPASRTAAANGTGVDLAGFDAAAIVIEAGAAGGTTPSFTFEVQDSDDNTTFTPVSSDFLEGTEPVITAGNSITKLGYHGIKRYVRVAITAAAGSSPTLLCSALVIRGKGRVKP
ncbi:hypothetical protein ACQEV4_42700 [Streptomyces shenzhenensis]|uniref:hypothetical protein n=1 Tax=Streptomyces shenzhenensis TaxID=943815 RepID=UPI003D90364D